MKYVARAVPLLLWAIWASGTYAGQTAKSAAEPRTLKVGLHYTGTGSVDEKHKIFVFLFNSTDFMEGDAHPIAVNTATTKDQTLTFSELNESPVYAAVVYDPSGDYDGHSRPPSGSSTAIYSKDSNVPAPITIEAGTTVQIDMTFDDTHKLRYS